MDYDDNPLDILPGIYTEDAEYAAGNRFVAGSNVRFWKGFAERIGGWATIVEDTLLAPARGMLAWRSLNTSQFVAFGSAEGLEILSGSELFDVSPTGVDGYITLVVSTVANTAQKVLLHFDGSDTSTTITDNNSGGSAHTWTAAGNAQIDTAQSKFGGASGLFDGTGDYVTTPDHADFTLGSGAWTVDFWFRCNVAGGTIERLCGQCDSTPTNASTSFRIQRTAANVIEAIACVSTAATTCTGTTQFTDAVNTGWHHCALVRTGDILRLFIDGAQEGSDGAISGTVNDSSSVLAVGTNGAVTTEPWTGWIDEFQLTVGAALWTAAFTPPAAAYNTTFTPGETVTTSAGGTGVVVDASGSTVNVSGDTGTFTGVLLGASSAATASITGTVNGGRIDGSATVGWGEGTWGSGVWGGAETIYANVLHPTTWTMANWGEDLIANPRGGKIYTWDASTGVGTNAARVSNSPSTALGIFVSDINRTLVAYGAHNGSADDPLNIRWSDAEDNTVWTAAATNTAGSQRCEVGNEIVGAISTRGGHLISTDAACYFFTYVGGQFIFDLTKVATGPAMISPRGGIDANDAVAYFMGLEGFYTFDGAVAELPCDVQSYVYGSFNKAQAFKVHAGTIRQFNEVIWFYCSGDATEIDRCVVVNVKDRTWWTGDVARTSWIDSSVVLNFPMATSAAGAIYAQEFGTTGAGADISYTLETGDMQIGDGSFLHARKLIPNYKRLTGSSHRVSIETRGYPARATVTKGPYVITESTDNLSVRARGRNVRLYWTGSDDFRMGRWQHRVTKHGARP
jgi:hypothetical protein